MKNLLDKTLFKWLALFCNSRHNLFWVYCVVLVFLMLGLMSDSGTQYILYLIVYAGIFLITYFSAEKFFNKSSVNKIISGAISKVELNNATIFSFVLLIATVIFMIAHFIYLGGVPTINAWQSHNSFEIYSIRKSVTADSSALINYLSSFVLKAILPFMLLYFYQRQNWKIFIAVFLISLFYCMAFVTKSYLVTALIPLLIFAVLQKKYFHVIAFSILIFAGLNFLVFVSNPSLRGGDTYHIQEQNLPRNASTNELKRSVEGLTDRTFLLPGKIVSDWFRVIPSQKPFLNGSGYHIISNLKGTEFRDYSTELYPVIFPDYAKRGYAGSVNVASFMYDFANFGLIGIMYSAIILALVFVFVNLIFSENNFIKLCINLFSVLVLSSSSFLTLAFSGGWGLMILLFLLFRKNFVMKTELAV